MTATGLRYVLIGLIILLLGGFVAGAWWLQGQLAQSVRATSRIVIDAEVTETELQQLTNLERQMASEQSVVKRAQQIAVSANQYQDQVIKDVSTYAARHGIAVNNFDFSTTSGQRQTKSGDTAPFSVTLRGPVSYISFMRLLRDLESNLPKINVTSLSLSPATDPTLITNPALNLEVYTKRDNP